MPALILAALRILVSLLIRYGGPILLQALVYFGLNFVTQSFVTTPFVHFIQASLSGAPAALVASLAAVNMDKAVTIILSAYVTAAAGRLFLRKRAAAP